MQGYLLGYLANLVIPTIFREITLKSHKTTPSSNYFVIRQNTKTNRKFKLPRQFVERKRVREGMRERGITKQIEKGS